MGDILGDAMNSKDDDLRRKRFKSFPQLQVQCAIMPPRPHEQNLPLHQAIENSNQQLFN